MSEDDTLEALATTSGKALAQFKTWEWVESLDKAWSKTYSASFKMVPPDFKTVLRSPAYMDAVIQFLTQVQKTFPEEALPALSRGHDLSVCLSRPSALATKDTMTSRSKEAYSTSLSFVDECCDFVLEDLAYLTFAVEVSRGEQAADMTVKMLSGRLEALRQKRLETWNRKESVADTVFRLVGHFGELRFAIATLVATYYQDAEQISTVLDEWDKILTQAKMSAGRETSGSG